MYAATASVLRASTRAYSSNAAKKVLVVGGGRVGRTISHMLAAERASGYSVRIVDAKPEVAHKIGQEFAQIGGVEASPEVASDPAGLRKAMKGMNAVISAAPFAANPAIAEAAAEVGIHYADLTEDVAVTRKVKDLAGNPTTKTAFVPQCGVAPGFIAIAGVHIIEQFKSVEEITLRVGALPDQPNNRLKYNLTWSTEGLVNEYVHPCESLRDYKVTMIPPLESFEEVVIDGVSYEAFSTSGGCGTLPHTYAGKIRKMDYKTLRYPGHRNLIKFLMEDLRFREHPEELVRIMQRSIPTTRDDFVIVSVRATGTDKEGHFSEKTFWRMIHGQHIHSHFFTGIEISTSAGVCGVVDSLLTGRLPQRGFVKVEDVPFDQFMASAFGRYYARRDRSM